MKVAYVFATNMAATFKLATMILPQLEDGSHGRASSGCSSLTTISSVCVRAIRSASLAKVAKDQNILLMICDQCAVRRNLAEGTLEQCGKGDVKAKGTVAGVQAGCFPQLYAALAPNAPDFVITL